MIGRILRFEPTRAKSNAVLVLGIALFALYVATVLLYVARSGDALLGFSEGAESPGEAFLVQLFTEATHEVVRALVMDGPPLLGTFFYAMLVMVPLFALLVAADQLSADIGRKHVRFLLPRAGRSSLYLARALGAWLTWSALAFASVAIAVAVLLPMDDRSGAVAQLLLSLRIVAVLVLYGAPFVAVMAFFNTFVPNGFVAYLAAVGYWLLFALLAGLGSWVRPELAYASYLIPTSVAYPLLSTEPSRLLVGVVGALAYTAAFLAAGAWLFRRRDL